MRSYDLFPSSAPQVRRQAGSRLKENLSQEMEFTENNSSFSLFFQEAGFVSQSSTFVKFIIAFIPILFQDV